MISKNSALPALPSTFIHPQSKQALHAFQFVSHWQTVFAQGINHLSHQYAQGEELQTTVWLRDQGQHGGGWRREGTDQGLLNRGSLNVSCVQYDDLPEKKLASATALSCILHPIHPYAPSLHTHISWTELKGGKGGWRLMADLNPSHPNEEDRLYFIEEIKHSFKGIDETVVHRALEEGDRYFKIPALNRHRGVAHFYLEQWNSGNFQAALHLAQNFARCVIQTYLFLFEKALKTRPLAAIPASAYQTQFDYHSLYFFQVLTLDRGTSSGLLVHQDNDLGIMGSLPHYMNPALLRHWISKLPAPQDALLESLIQVLPEKAPYVLTPDVRLKLAQCVRQHYKRHPQALTLQARGSILPPTVSNHQSADT